MQGVKISWTPGVDRVLESSCAREFGGDVVVGLVQSWQYSEASIPYSRHHDHISDNPCGNLFIDAYFERCISVDTTNSSTC
jgi:hypothetical protein